MITLWLLFRELGYRLPALCPWVTALLFLALDWGGADSLIPTSFVAVAFWWD